MTGAGERVAPRVVLGVTGGIAAYKACELLRRFTESGHDVTVVPTRAALEFVGAATWAALSGKPVSADVWDDVHEVPHVRIGQSAGVTELLELPQRRLGSPKTAFSLGRVLLQTRELLVPQPEHHFQRKHA